MEWSSLLANTAAQALSGSKASGPGAGAATISPTSRADFGSQDFSFGNISLGSKDKTALWLAGAALIVALVGVVLVVRG